MLNALQKTVAKHIYALLSAFNEDQRVGATLALSTLIVLAEDGYLSSDAQAVGFHEYCYNILSGASVSLKMLKDDNIITEEMENNISIAYNPKSSLCEAELALVRVEELLKNIILTQGEART